MQFLSIHAEATFQDCAGGLFISHGIGRHITRRFPSTEHELIFVRSGSLHIREENERFEIGPNETILLSPGKLHAGTADYDADLQFYWIHFHCTSSLVQEEDRASALRVPKHCHVARPQVLEMYFRRYLNDASEQRLSSLSASALMTLMLTELTVPDPVDATPASSPNIVAGRAYVYIQSHLHLPLTTSMVAQEMNCSAGYLSRVFRMVHGRTITDAIHSERILHAQKLIINTDLDIEAIAGESGFPSTSYFIKLFKRHTGMTPLAYRRLHARMFVNMEYEKIS
jgi:AraC-like DNA-binding protein